MKTEKLIFITGAPSIGKTVLGEAILLKTSNSAFLDGDWLWHVNPFDLNDKRLRNGDKSMAFALRTYLTSDFEYVIFSSVILVVPEIRERILKDLGCTSFTCICFHLKCSRDTLLQRHRGQKLFYDPVYEWLDITPLPNDIVLDTNNMEIDDIASSIVRYTDQICLSSFPANEIKLFTNRMILRTVTIDDRIDVINGLKLDDGPCEEEEAIKEIEWMNNNHRNNHLIGLTHICLAMIDRNERDIIGWCGFDNRIKNMDSPALFYLLKKKYWNSGLATEAAKALLEYGFSILKLSKVHAGVDKHNVSSKRVLEKIGMNYIRLDGEGGFHFELTNDEYIEREGKITIAST